MNVIQIFTPVADYTDEEIDFYAEVNNAMIQWKSQDNNILMVKSQCKCEVCINRWQGGKM